MYHEKNYDSTNKSQLLNALAGFARSGHTRDIIYYPDEEPIKTHTEAGLILHCPHCRLDLSR